MKFVLATQNPKKLTEMSAILSDLGVEVVSEADLGVKIEVEETGETFAENSLLKARAVMEATKLPAIADDSGLCVDALNGGPGVYSARFGGEGLDDTGRYRLLLQMMHGRPTAAPTSTRPSPARSRTAIFCRTMARSRVRSPLRRWAKTASATIPCSSCLTSERPLHSSRRKRRRRSRTAARHCGHSRRRSRIILRNINKKG